MAPQNLYMKLNPKTLVLVFLLILITPITGYNQGQDEAKTGALILKHRKKNNTKVIEVGEKISVLSTDSKYTGTIQEIKNDTIVLKPFKGESWEVDLDVKKIRKINHLRFNAFVRGTGLTMKIVSYPLIFLTSGISIGTIGEFDFDEPLYYVVVGMPAAVIGFDRLGGFMWRKRYHVSGIFNKWGVSTDVSR